MYSQILVPIDTTYANSDWLKEPLQTAWKFSQESNGTLHLVSVIPDNILKGYYPDVYSDSVSHDVRAKLDTIAKNALPPDSRIKQHILQGGICHEILRLAQEINASVIIMASHGPVLKDYLIGSNAGYIALHARCSVFVVRGQTIR